MQALQVNIKNTAPIEKYNTLGDIPKDTILYYHQTENENYIPVVVRHKVRDMLMSIYFSGDGNCPAIFTAIPNISDDDFWTWVNNEGKLTKRISKAIRNKYDYKMPAESISKIGNILSDRGNYKDDLYFQFDTSEECWWDDGDFGNDESCWWNEYADSLTTHYENGGKSMLLYKKEKDSPDKVIDTGRIWTVDTPHGLLLYNAYGKYELRQIASFLCDILDSEYQYKKVIIDAETGKQSIPYINNSSGYIITKDIDNCPNEIRLGWDYVFNENSSFMSCYGCGHRVHEDEYYYSERTNEGYCSECFNDIHTQCAVCYEYTLNEETETVISNDWKENWCDNCIDNNSVVECYNCSDKLNAETTNVYHTEYSYYCETCADNCQEHTVGECENCEDETT